MQPQLQGALFLKWKGPLKGDSQKTRVIKATLVGPVTKKSEEERNHQIFKKKREKISPGVEVVQWSFCVLLLLPFYLPTENKMIMIMMMFKTMDCKGIHIMIVYKIMNNAFFFKISAPEVLLAKNYGPEVDMWAVGVITYIM